MIEQDISTPDLLARYWDDTRRMESLCRDMGALIGDELFAAFGRTGIPPGYLAEVVDPQVDGALDAVAEEYGIADADVDRVKWRIMSYCVERMELLCLPPAGTA